MLGPSYYCLYSVFNKIKERAKIVLPGSEGVGARGRVRGNAGEMTQTLYAHMNKRNKKN
jgi:hypothetical protein